MIVQMAWRNIWRNRMRSLVIALSVAVGLFAGLAVLAIYKGMLISRVRTLIYTEVGHIQVHHPDFKKDNDPRFILNNKIRWLEILPGSAEVKAVTARSVTPAMLATSSGSAGVMVNGITPGTEEEVSQLSKKIIEGRGINPLRKNELFLGKKLASKMKLKPGSKLVLTFTDTTSDLVSAAFRVAGIYQTSNAPLDERNVFVHINDLNELLGIGNSFHELVIILKEDNILDEKVRQLKKDLPGALVESWKEIAPEAQLMVSTMDYYMLIIIGIIMLALAFGIINTMLMAILERTREIGMMVALGMNRARVYILVLLETVFLTLLGTPLGLLVAWLTIGYFNERGLDTSSFAGETMSSFGFSAMVYPEFPADRLPVVMMIVIATALISCIFPAVKSGRMQPVVALRK